MNKKKSEESQRKHPSKRPYVAPVLQEFGNIARITGKTSGTPDGSSGMMN
jgi:hypothetical protein